jgi:hypothetical protein
MVRRVNQLQPVSAGSRYDHQGLVLAQSDLPVAALRFFSVVMEQRENSMFYLKCRKTRDGTSKCSKLFKEMKLSPYACL